MKEKIIILINILLVLIIVFLSFITFKLILLIREQNQSIRICNLQKQEIQDICFDSCYFNEY
jgi:hypothetical protein